MRAFPLYYITGEYIALDNPVRAVTFIDEITNSLKKTLSLFPLSGKVAEDLALDEEIRMLPHGNYVSYYRCRFSIFLQLLTVSGFRNK